MSITEEITIIDPHIHLFNLKQGDYHWLNANNPPYWSDKATIIHNFTEQDLSLNSPFTLAGFVHIEAGFDNNKPWREIAWLEQHCHKPFRSIAFIDLLQAPKNFKQQLDKLLSFQSVIGIRHILDEQALATLSHKNTVKNIIYLAEKKLLLEVQMLLTDVKALQQLIEILNTVAIKAVINHAGFPPIKQNQSAWQQWQQGLSLLAQQPNCFIKCSGWEMSFRDYTFTWVAEVITCCINYFGEQRVMLASNFPLCNFTSSYQQLWQNYQQLTFSKQQLKQLNYQNANACYQLN